jgi:hypothetical protein
MPFYVIHDKDGNVVKQGWSSLASLDQKPKSMGEELLVTPTMQKDADEKMRVEGKGKYRRLVEKHGGR